MRNGKEQLRQIESALKAGQIDRLKTSYARLLSEGRLSDVKEISSRLLFPASPACHTLLYAMTEEYALQNNFYSLAPFLSCLAERIGERELSLFWKKVYGEYFSPEKKRAQEVAGEFYAHEYEGVYEYNGKRYPLRVASFSREIGRNMTALVTRYGVILFDCGAAAMREGNDEMSSGEVAAFFERNGFRAEDVVAVFLSHAHLDHYGSIGVLAKVGIPESKVYADPATLAIVKRQTGSLPLFSVHAQFYHPRLKVEPFYNGHILGSCGYCVSFDGQNIVYTGDFCLHDQRTVAGLNVKDVQRAGSIFRHGVSLLVTESTYGQTDDGLSYEDYRRLFAYFDRRLKKLKIRKFYPAFAVGRSQEVLLNLSSEQRILLSGASESMTELFSKLLKRNLVKGNVKRGGGNDTFDAVVCSSGMLAENSASHRYAVKFMNEEAPTAMLLTGYMAKEGSGYEVMREWILSGKTLLPLPLSAHADRSELVELIQALKPKRILTVHGEGIAGANYQNEEILSLPKEVRRGENGDSRSQEEIGLQKQMAFLQALSELNGVPIAENAAYREKERALRAIEKNER